MIKRFNDEKPIEDNYYDVFGPNGDYYGYLRYVEGFWDTNPLGPEEMCNNDLKWFTAENTYYSDDHDDWLRMIEGLIEVQNKYNK